MAARQRMSVVSIFDWRSELSELQGRLGELFARSEPRRQSGLYLEGLLSAVERKNGWQPAEHIGDARPWRTQRVLSHVQWDEEAARDLCRAYVLEPLTESGGGADCRRDRLSEEEHEVGRRGTPIQRHAGRIENCHIGALCQMIPLAITHRYSPISGHTVGDINTKSQ